MYGGSVLPPDTIHFCLIASLWGTRIHTQWDICSLQFPWEREGGSEVQSTFGVSISLLRDHSLQAGRDSSFLFQIPIFGDACLTPPSIFNLVFGHFISCFHEISQNILLFLSFLVNSAFPDANLFNWAAELHGLIAFVARLQFLTEIFSNWVDSCWWILWWSSYHAPNLFNWTATLPYHIPDSDMNPQRFPLRSSNGNQLSSSNFLEKEKARSAIILIVVAYVFDFCGISINR